MNRVEMFERALNGRSCPSTSMDVAKGFGVTFSTNSVEGAASREEVLSLAASKREPAWAAARLRVRFGVDYRTGGDSLFAAELVRARLLA